MAGKKKPELAERTEKTCNRCKETKPLSDFSTDYKRSPDGRGYTCRDCLAIMQRDYRARNPEKIKELNDKRNKLRTRDQLNRHPEKVKARSQLSNAVARGRIKKQNFCSGCLEKNERIEGHHEDYAQPLDVVWLCPDCHGFIHSMDRFK